MLDVEALADLARYFPELGPYVYPLQAPELSEIGYGRIRMQQWQVVHQHMLIMRRSWCHDRGLDFYATEKTVEAKIKRAKILTEPVIHWMLVTAGTYGHAWGEWAPYNDLKGML